MNIFSFSVSGESVAGIPAIRKFGLIALTVALAALTSTHTALAARRHHAAALPYAALDDGGAGLGLD